MDFVIFTEKILNGKLHFFCRKTCTTKEKDEVSK